MEQKMKNIIKILIWTFIIGIIIYFLIGIFFNLIASNICKTECSERNYEFYDIKNSGNFKIDDLCICLSENKTERFRLND